MAKELPFDEDVMTLIMGVGGPDKPGQHGRTVTEMPEMNEIDLITQIRDLCDEFLTKAAKDSKSGESKDMEQAPEEEEAE